MESIRELLASFRDSFFQLKDNIIKWFQSLRGTNPEISNDKIEMPPMQDGPASRTRSTSIPPPEYDRAGFKSESKNFALKHFGLYPEVSILFFVKKKNIDIKLLHHGFIGKRRKFV